MPGLRIALTIDRGHFRSEAAALKSTGTVISNRGRSASSVSNCFPRSRTDSFNQAEMMLWRAI
jgi:hypothetical protein